MKPAVSKPEIPRKFFFELLVLSFPEIKDDVLDEDYEGLIYLQVGCLARYANVCIRESNMVRLAEIFKFFIDTVDRVESEVENALYVSFLEHIEMDGETVSAKSARNLMGPKYLTIWAGLRNQ